MAEPTHKPYVPPDTDMKEFTIRALIIGLVMCVVLGAANAYLGLKAGMTIAATYPAAVIGMAMLRLWKGSILEENFARTVGSIGESVAAGAVFTIPAFVVLGLWKFSPETMWTEYLTASALMILGGILGIMFVTVLRRVMVEDTSLPFPESVAAGEIHKAGQRGADAALQLFKAMGVGAVIKLLDGLRVFQASNDFQVTVGRVKESFVKLGLTDKAEKDRYRRRYDDLCTRSNTGVYRRGVHYRSRTRRLELRRGIAGVGSLRSAPRLFYRPNRDRQVSVEQQRQLMMLPGRLSPDICTGISFGPLPWAACSSVQPTRSGKCAKT